MVNVGYIFECFRYFNENTSWTYAWYVTRITVDMHGLWSMLIIYWNIKNNNIQGIYGYTSTFVALTWIILLTVLGSQCDVHVAE